MNALKILQRPAVPLIGLLALLAFAAAPASAETPPAPWWGITTGSRPTDLRPGAGKDQVQELTISATRGEWSFGELTPHIEHHDLLEALLPFNAGASQVQEALVKAEPAHRVRSVSGGPADVATGRLIGPATATGSLTAGLATVQEVAKEPFTGVFAVGQQIEGTGIPAGTTIVKIEGATLILSKNATAKGSGVALTGLPSNTVEDFTTTGGTFALGQEVLGVGIAAGTTIEAIAGSTVTLSLPATETKASAVLSSALRPYEITFEDQGGVPLVKAESFPGEIFGKKIECAQLEPSFGSCAGDPSKILEALQGGAKPQPEVTLKSEGSFDGQLVVEAENLGDREANGCSAVPAGSGKYANAACSEPAGSPSEGLFEKTPVTITDTLPTGLTAVSAQAHEGLNDNGPSEPCAVEAAGRRVTCTDGAGVSAFNQIEVLIGVRVEPSARTGEVNTAMVSGGGATAAGTAKHGIEVNSSERFGTEEYSLVPEKPGGSVATQAGSHPFQLTSVVTANSTYNLKQEFEGATGRAFHEWPRTVALPRDDVGELPAGMVGNPTPFAQCTDAQFATAPANHEETGAANECPASSAVGVALIHFAGIGGLSGIESKSARSPIFNMVPGPGEPARFGFKVFGIVPVYLNASVRTGSDYGVTVGAHDIIQIQALMSAKLTFWGIPGSPAHDQQRGWECLEKSPQFSGASCPTTSASEPPPFLIMPTSCNQPWVSTLQADSWPSEGSPSVQAKPLTYHLEEAGHPVKLDGCNHLPFSPSVSVTPDLPNASTSTGLTADVHVPQTAELNPEGLAESSVKDITVTLPEGVAVNPSGGDGLGACTGNPADSPGTPGNQIGFEGEGESATDAGVRNLLFKPALPGSFGSTESFQPGLNFCSNASKIGTADISTPLLPKGQDVKGSVYLATQNENPFGSLIAMYIVAEDPVSGTLVKLPGKVSLNPSTGQLTTTFENSPELPFEDARLSFFGGERAPLATPAHCGTYTTTASFVPWSAEPEDEAAVTTHASATFTIEHGPNGGPCPGATLPFSASLTGGTSNINAGGFSPLTTTISRADGQQDMQSVQLHMPAGLEGLLSNVKLCPEAQANEGSCGPESLIGETIVSAGVGSDPVSVTGGRVYLTEKYAGAPFGLSIVNPVKAGPFDLEHDTANSPAQTPPCDCVVVRARIEVDPQTAELTITTDPSGPHAIPHMIDGVPVQIQHVNVTVNREHFTFNPTNCNPMSITGMIGSDEGLISPVSVPFQATNCKNLSFTPKFTVSTSGKTSKVNGASLTTKVAEPAGALGTQANIARVKVDLPVQLPSRLTTLQKACLAAVFNANPANCPSASLIGHAKVITPLLPVPLEGPAIFVSHGGEAFPSLEIVLRGYGVTVDLVGTTFISKKGITSTTFKTVPDTPFNTFELTLPQGKFSALGANLPAKAKGSFCGQSLKMPTEFVAQNGAVIHQTTPIAVTGCKKPKKAKHHKKHSRKKKG